jgi:hypothetical protein
VLGEYFDGRIDEVRVYNRALDTAEVAADMEAPIQTPQQGPVAAWSFDEIEGGTAEDLTGNSHIATLEGATTAPGRYGDALQFDGEEDCVSIAESEDLRFDEEFSLEAWVRPEAGGSSEGPLVTQEDEAFAEGEEPYAYSLLSGAPETSPMGWVRITGEHDYEGVYGTEPLTRNVWSHLALTDDGAHLRLYQDGELVRTAPAPILTTAHGDLRIGCIPIFGAYFKGRVDEVRIYNRAKSGPELADVVAPRFAEPFYAVALPGEEEGALGSTTVFFSEAADPLLADGKAGMGLKGYLYRTRIGSESFSPWTESPDPAISVAGAEVGDELTLEVIAVDRADNFSENVRKTIQISEPEESSEAFPVTYWNESEEGLTRGVAPSKIEDRITKELKAGAVCAIGQTLIGEKEITINRETFNYIRSDVYFRCKLAARLIFTAIRPYFLHESTGGTFPRVTEHKWTEGGTGIPTRGPFPVTQVCKKGSNDSNWKAGVVVAFAHLEVVDDLVVPVTTRIPPPFVTPNLPKQRRQCQLK